ncbi:mannosyltransferase [Kitasatospora cineracea]|uniref:Mannosyltransferase n=1 Tax=Kitasatospora cineracea TaxID=88074 RepID=A0A3N4S3D9_9ACTN|nr:mannosyltransferase [Kitasatospora cineracea]
MFRRLRVPSGSPPVTGAPVLPLPLPRPRARPRARLRFRPRHSASALRGDRHGRWLWPAALAFVLGAYRIGTPQLWRDELATWSAATRSTGELLDLLHRVDAVSGAYYLALHYWIAVFGDSPTSLRAPGLLAMTATAALVALGAGKLFGAPAALPAGLLFAALPSVSRYAQEARGYAFAVLAVAAATWLLLRALEEPGPVRPRWWCGYAVCVLLAGAFHLVAVSALAGHAAVVAIRLRGRPWRHVLPGYGLACAGAAAALLPLVLAGQRQAGRQISWIGAPPVSGLVKVLPSLFGSGALAVGLLAVAAPACVRRASRAAALQAVLLAVLPLLAVWVLSQGSSSYWTGRYLLFTVPAWAMLAGAGVGVGVGVGVGAPGRRGVRPALLLVLGALALPTQWGLRAADAHDDYDLKGTAELLAADYRPGDAIVPPRGGASYLMLDLGMRYYLPRSDRLRDVFVQTDAVRLNDFFALECPVPADCLGSDPRVWVVTVGESPDPYADLSPAQAEALKSRYTPVRTSHAGGLTLTLLARGQ